jgi:hypothetical protein
MTAQIDFHIKNLVVHQILYKLEFFNYFYVVRKSIDLIIMSLSKEVNF